MANTDILIIGGGPAGLAAAIATRRKGFNEAVGWQAVGLRRGPRVLGPSHSRRRRYQMLSLSGIRFNCVLESRRAACSISGLRGSLPDPCARNRGGDKPHGCASIRCAGYGMHPTSSLQYLDAKGELAAKHSPAAGASEKDAIAEVRKCFKRVRAALRLAREEFGDDLYHEENWCFRDAARPLTLVRDARVSVETADEWSYSSSCSGSGRGLMRRSTRLDRKSAGSGALGRRR